MDVLNKIKYAIFDMDGTVVDSLAFWEVLWADIGEKYFSDKSFRVSEEIDKYVRTKTLKDACRVMREKCAIPDTDEGFFEFCAQGLEDYYKTAVRPKKGAVELLNLLRERGVKMCIASATEPRLIRLSLENCNLTDYFEFIISCTDVGVGKEKPDVFLEALRRLEGNIEDACVFEDSFVALETAERAGFMTVGVFDRNNYEQERLKAASDIYVDENMSFIDILPKN